VPRSAQEIEQEAITADGGHSLYRRLLTNEKHPILRVPNFEPQPYGALRMNIIGGFQQQSQATHLKRLHVVYVFFAGARVCQAYSLVTGNDLS
jgi:hypothetical protein